MNFPALVSLPISARRASQRSANSSYSRPRSARKHCTIIAASSGDDSETLSTNAFPPCLRTVSCNFSKNCKCAVVCGSTQEPFSIPAAPMACSRRHSATRALDGELGNWAKKSSQAQEILSVAIYM